MKWANLSSAKAFSKDKMAKNNLFDTPRMFCDVYCLEPGQSQKAHSHQGSDKVYVILDGRGRFSVAGEEQVLGPGEVVLVSPGEEHGVVNDSQQRLSLLVFMCPKP